MLSYPISIINYGLNGNIVIYMTYTSNIYYEVMHLGILNKKLSPVCTLYFYFQKQTYPKNTSVTKPANSNEQAKHPMHNW